MSGQMFLKSPEGWGSDDERDEHKHRSMLDAITALQGQTNIHHQRSETTKASEFFSSGTDRKVRMYDLVKGLPETVAHTKLRKKIEHAESKAKQTRTPLAKHQREKIERSIAYDKAKTELRRWKPLVTHNRRAEQLNFPLEREGVKVISTKALISHKPSTVLEQEVAKLLNQSPNVLQPTKMLTEAEEKALLAMSLEQAKQRRIELQKHRALISHQAAKLRRQHKIKSKSYRRILKKEKTKKELEALDLLRTTDPEAFLQRLGEVDKERIKERMSLKHRVKGRRLRKQAKYAKYNDGMREAVQEMVRKNKELTKKVRVESDSDDNDVTEAILQDDVTVGGQFPIAQSVRASKNPWMSAAIKTKPCQVSKLEEMVNKEAIGQAEEVTDFSVKCDDKEHGLDTQRVADSQCDKPSGAVAKASVSVGDIDAIFSTPANKRKRKAVESKGKKKKKKKAKTSKANTQTKSDTEKADIKKETGITQEVEKPEVEVEEPEAEVEEPEVEEEEEPEAVDSDAEMAVSDDDGGEELHLSATRRQNVEDFEGDWVDQEEANRLEVPSRNLQAAKTHPSADKGTASGARETEVAINPEKFMAVETSLETPSGLGLVDDEDQEDQRMTIAQAFAADDVMAEFEEEKREEAEREAPKDVCFALPGWGQWGGEGIAMPQHKKDRLTVKAPKIQRLDEDKNKVIISQARDKKVGKHQVNTLPHGMFSAEAFEKQLEKPIGKNWNPETIYRKLTKPRVTTQLGAVIEPISKDMLTKFEKRREKEREEREAQKLAEEKKTEESARARKEKKQQQAWKKKRLRAKSSVIKI